MTDAQAQDILGLIGVTGPARVTRVKENNHVFQIGNAADAFYLKAYTKDWYGGDVEGTSYCVRHEQSAWSVLARHGLSVPDVVLACQDMDNPLGRPFLMTRGLRGDPLTVLLGKADRAQADLLLRATGDYLCRMHTITFEFPGYITGGGPESQPNEEKWQHRCWTAQARQKAAFAMIEREVADMTAEQVPELKARFSDMERTLSVAYQAPRFVHADCHASQFFLYLERNEWQVSGVVDMEVASAGDPVEDLLKFSIEMAATRPSSTRWWEPLFAGYGGEPDFASFRLRWLGLEAIEFWCQGWRASRRDMVASFLTADTWHKLFNSSCYRCGFRPGYCTPVRSGRPSARSLRA